jgi:hypothetical protein
MAIVHDIAEGIVALSSSFRRSDWKFFGAMRESGM